jgi:hypothetical protein
MRPITARWVAWQFAAKFPRLAVEIGIQLRQVGIGTAPPRLLAMAITDSG